MRLIHHIISLLLMLFTTAVKGQLDEDCTVNAGSFECNGCTSTSCLNCTVTPAYSANEYFCPETRFNARCHHYLLVEAGVNVTISQEFTLDGTDFSELNSGYTRCSGRNACAEAWLNNSVGELVLFDNFIQDGPWSLGSRIATLPSFLIDSIGLNFPALKAYNTAEPPEQSLTLQGTLALPDSPQNLVNLTAEAKLNTGLPYARFNFTSNIHCGSSYSVQINVTNENTTTDYNHSVHPGLATFHVGPLPRGAVVTATVEGLKAQVARIEQLSDINASGQPPQLQFSWHNVSDPALVGEVSALGARQPLPLNCTSEQNQSQLADYHCTLPLGNLLPQPWILITAGTLPDAETRNQSTLHFWQLSGFQGEQHGQQLTGEWQPAPVVAERYQLRLDCPNGMIEQSTQQSSQILTPSPLNGHCNLTLTPEYQGQSWSELATVISLFINDTVDASVTVTGMPMVTSSTFYSAPEATPSNSPEPPAATESGENNVILPIGVAVAVVGVVVSVTVVVAGVGLCLYYKHNKIPVPADKP